jgi:predicted small lipoprotein YifL
MRRVIGSVVVLGMLALTGCGGGDPLPTLPPTPTATPVFASEEEALAAAEAAYAAYLEMSNLISSEGGVDPERIEPFVTDQRLVDELRGFGTLSELNLRTVGTSSFTVLELQRYEESDGGAEIAFYACSDLSGSRVIDEAGEDVTPPERDDRMVLEVVLRTIPPLDRLVLESDETWLGQDC